MKNIKITLTLLFCIAISTFTFAQQATNYDWDKNIPVAELREDFRILRSHFEQIQPGLYTYTNKADLDARWNAIEKRINRPMTEVEFYRRLAPILKLIGNGHTDITISDACNQYIRKEAKVFPIYTIWLDHTLYVSKNLSTNPDIPRGAKIVSINGENATIIFTKIRSYLTRDGENLTLPNRSTALRFWRYYPLHFGFPEQFELELELADGSLKKVIVEADTHANMMKRYEAQFGKFKHWYTDKEEVLKLDIQGDIATMKIQVFGMDLMKRVKQDHEKFFKAAFEKIDKAGVKHLIIDLRGNGGGDAEPTVDLFQYLHDKPFTFYKEVSTITRKFPDKKYYEDKLFFTQLFAPFLVKKEGDIYTLRRQAGMEEVQPKSPHYGGNVYVLTDASSFSATGEMTAIIKEHNRAIFIGEEPGGNPNQNTSGMMLQLVLPYSKINVINPIVLWKMNVNFENTGHGVMPDHPIMPTIEEYIEGKDVVMEYALKLIEAER